MTIGQRLKGIVRSAGSNAASGAADALFLAGAGAVSYGAWLMYAPAGFIVGGVLAMVAGVIVARGA